MDAAERAQQKSAIVDELAPLLYERFAAETWGRLLVTVTRPGDGADYRVASIDVDDIVGDEGAIERAFGALEQDGLLTMLAAAIEALSVLSGVDLEQTTGGTLVRTQDDGFGFLPGLVRAPSAAFEARRDGEVEELERRWRGLSAKLPSSRIAFDAEAGRVTFLDDGGAPAGEARGVLVGSFSRRSHAWRWGWAHDNLPEPMRRAVKDVLDDILDRSIWEASERQFGSDEPTAWALCALFRSESNADAVLRLSHAEGSVFVAVYDVQTSGDEPDGGEPEGGEP